MSRDARRRRAFLALQASLEAEKRLNALKSRRLRRAHAIRRRLQALQRNQTTRRLQACIVILSLFCQHKSSEVSGLYQGMSVRLCDCICLLSCDIVYLV